MRSVLTDDLIDISMNEQRRHDGLDTPGHQRPELRKSKTMKTIDELVNATNALENQSPNLHALDARSRISPPSPSSKKYQLLRDYEMAQSILESRNRGEFSRSRPQISFEQHRRNMDKATQSAPGGRPRVALAANEDVRRSLRSASEAYLRRGEVPASSSSNSANSSNNTSSSRDEDSSGNGKSKKKKTVSFQDESSGSMSRNPVSGVELSSGSRRQNMDSARCLDDESGPGNGHASSPIHAACFKGDHLVVTHQLSFFNHNQDAAQLVNSTCSCGMTPLQVACDQGHAKVVKLLLKRQARITKRSSHSSGHASNSGSGSRSSSVLSSGGFAVGGHTKKRHRSCLALASARGSAEVVELLLEFGAQTDEDALVTASSLGDAAVVKLLLQSHKKTGLAGGLEKLWGGSSSSSSSGFSCSGSGELEPAWISSAAAAAVAHAHPAILLALLGDGHASTSRDRIVHCAVEAATLADYKLLRCLTKLFDHALLTPARDAHQNSLLHLAVKQGSARCVTLLVRLGVDVNARDALGITPLYMACARGQSSIAKLLLNAGASCNAMGPNDETPLHIAAQENHLSCVTVLLTTGRAAVDGATLDKCTALHLACQRGNTAVAKCLLDHGADVNARTVCDETPLLKASRMSNMETVKLLLARDADIATSSTSSISSCGSSGGSGVRQMHTASTASSVFSTGSSVRSLDATLESSDGRTNSTASSSSSRRPHALLQRLAEHQLPRRPSSEDKHEERTIESTTGSDQIFLAKSNSRKSFKGWLKSVVKSK